MATTWPWPAPARSRACCSATSSVLTPDKAGEPARRSGLQAPPERTGPDQLKHLHRLCQPLDRHRPQGRDLDQPFGQPQRRCGQANAARRGQLLHARRQVRGLANRRVVHVQIVANGAHHHFTGVEADADLHLAPRGCGAPPRCSDACRLAWPGPHSRPAPHGLHGPGAPQTAP